jgi:ribosomal protein L28
MVPIEKKLFILINNALIGKNTKKQRDLLFKNILNILKYIKIFNICFFPHKDVCLLIFKSADMLKQEVDSHVISHNLNVTVLNILPKNITWLNAITTISQLPIFYILNDPTWNFELNSNRLIRNAAALFNDGTSGSRHKEKVVKLLHKPVRTLTKKTFICLNFQNTITVIDGNHAAVALAISANTLRISQHTLIYLIVGYSDNLNSFPFVN